LVIALAILAAIAIYMYTAYQSAASDLIVERDRQVAYLSAVGFRDELVKYSDDLLVLARMLDGSVQNQSALMAGIARMRERLAIFDGGVVVLDRLGFVRFAEPQRPEIMGDNWSDRPFFQFLLSSAGLYVSDATSDGPGGADVVAISVPIVDRTGNSGGSVVGMLLIGSPTTRSLYASILRMRLGQSGNTYVVDGNGKILYDSAYRDASDSLKMSGLPSGFMQTQGARRTRDAAGHDIVAAHAGIPSTRWTLVAEDDWTILSSPVRRYATNLFALLALGIILPPLGVVLLVRDQRAEARERERAEQETHVANLIQAMLLPRQTPTLPGWDIAIHYQPTRLGGRDFYDFHFRPDGSLMLTVGEVSERGLAAAHLIGTLRATLRGAAHRQLPPHEALECSNDLLCPEISAGMSLRCLYAIIEPADGRLRYASAGVPAPQSCSGAGVGEAPAVGAPLGETLGARYSQHEAIVGRGDRFVIYTSALPDTRNAQGETFGAARLQAALGQAQDSAQATIERLAADVAAFRGKRASIEDDFAIVVLQRQGDARVHAAADPAASRVGMAV
jgi:serine phosphatase RsbU (regulator of sigma subunit)